MKIDDRFSPAVAGLGAPSGKNTLGILGAGLAAFQDNKDQLEEARDNKVFKDIKLQDVKDKLADEKQIVKYQEHLDGGGNRRTWLEGGNSFLTSFGVSNAEKIDRDRAVLRLKESKNSAYIRKMNKATSTKRTRGARRARGAVGSAYRVNAGASVGAGALADYNKSLATPPAPTPVTKTVTVYKNGKPITYTIGG